MFFNKRTAAVLALAASSLIIIPGCAVTRDQSTMGEYIDDAAITTKIKAKFVDAKSVDAASIKVETLNGTVMLSGFAKSNEERATAEKLARETSGVVAVRNDIAVRP